MSEDEVLASGATPANEPTSTTRLSFGVELEFLIAMSRWPTEEDNMDADHSISGDPDARIADKLPPLHPESANSFAAIKKTLAGKGIKAWDTWTDPEGKGIDMSDYWIIKGDSSVKEASLEEYNWDTVEITSPACYAFDEAFDMVRLVVSLITTNFRCRINSSTGFHVHVGNGKQQFDLRTLRNFGAVWWAVEPLLAVLHPPERMVCSWSTSTRRICSTNGQLAESVRNARNAHGSMLGGYVGAASRYFGRSRKLGESKVASTKKWEHRYNKDLVAGIDPDWQDFSETRLCGMDWSSDDSD